MKPDRQASTAATTWPLTARGPVPNFPTCHNCGADARKWVTWDNADGWCCSKCGGCDADE
jgi:hypothetical protein